jgi:ATP-dependent DNA helicase RecG
VSAKLNREPRERLREALAKYGASIAGDERRCRSILNDKCGRYVQEVNLLMLALQERIPADLQADATAIPELLLARLANRLRNNLAMTEEAARWVVESWAIALGRIPAPVPLLGQIPFGIRMEDLLERVEGIGPALAAELRSAGLTTVEDLLGYVPFRYEDRRNVKSVAQLAPGEMATVICSVLSARMSGLNRHSLELFEARFTDASRAILVAKWFHGGYLADVFREGMKVVLFGKVEFDDHAGELTMLHPEFEVHAGDDDEGDAAVHVGRAVPIYEGTGKLNTRAIRTFMHRVLQAIEPVDDTLPDLLRARMKMPDRLTALRDTHFPPAESDLRLLNAFRSPAQFRMIFEEFFWLETGSALKRGKALGMPGIAFKLSDRVRERVKAMLPFKPTGSQKRVLSEIAADMLQPHRMKRLLQGDVGSGKTIVAAEAAVIAIENGYQAALVAPTHARAARSYQSMQPLFAELGYSSVLLAESDSVEETLRKKRLIAQGLAQFVAGALALLENNLEFERLGLLVVDEQNRFRPGQCFELATKGLKPDVLVMTAAPTPRTLAMTIYGDLDVSVIDEMPPGRKPIVTKHATSDQVEQVYTFLKRQIDEGRQAYVVYPVIEESEAQDMKAIQRAYEHLSKEVFPDIPVGLMHGNLGADAEEAAMRRFKEGQTKILVSTIVVEDGVDVPNASVMVVEQAERFGLAQLHQLRGRMGCGTAQSYCLLVTEKLDETARERIRTLVESDDGFYIAEMDLKLRGPGEFLSGMPSLRIANILRDGEILEVARREAVDFVERPPSQEELRKAVEYIRDHWQRLYGLVAVG